jgi:hypothetical protein
MENQNQNNTKNLEKWWDSASGWQVEQELGREVLKSEGYSWVKLQKGKEWTDYSVKLCIKIVKGIVRIYYQASDKGRYFVSFREEGISLSREAPLGVFSHLAKSHIHHELGIWHDINITYKSKKVEVIVNGVIEIEFLDTRPLISGDIAFETLDDSYMYVRDMKVTPELQRVTDLRVMEKLRQEGRLFATRKQALKVFSKGEYASKKAVLYAETGDVIDAQKVGSEAERLFRQAIIKGLTDELKRQKRVIKQKTTSILVQYHKKLTKAIGKAKGFLNKAEDENLEAIKFLDLVEKIKVTLLAGGAFPDLSIEWFGYEVPFSNINSKGIYPFPPLTDRSTIFQVCITNIGIVPIDTSFSTNLYVDGNLVKTFVFPTEAEKLDIGSSTKIMIKPGGSRVYGHGITFTEAGSHKIRWEVDAKKEITEIDESNNELEVTANWQEPPDLVVEDIQPVGKPVGGQKTEWKITVTNIGKGDVIIPFMTTFLPDVPGASQENFWATSLGAGKSINFTSTQRFRSWGKRMMKAVTDVGNNIPEALPSGEEKNELVKEFDLAPVDLVVHDLIVSQKLSQTTFSFTLGNQGSGDATQPFSVRFWPGTIKEKITYQPSSSYGNAGEGIGWKTFSDFVKIEKILEPALLPVKKLSAGESITMEHSMSLDPGGYRVLIEADPDAVYFEPDHDNNILGEQINIPEGISEVMNKLGIQICRVNPKPRISNNIKAILWAKNYVYVDPNWNTNQKKNYISFYAQKIPKVFEEMNNYYKQIGLNIHIAVHPDYLAKGIENADMVISDCDYWGPKGKNVDWVSVIAKQDTKFVHIHWHQRSSSIAEGYGSPPIHQPFSQFNWIGMAISDIDTRPILGLASTLAHEFGHFFEFDSHSNQEDNLMGDVKGDKLTTTQISEIWNSINTKRDHLICVSYE